MQKIWVCGARGQIGQAVNDVDVKNWNLKC